MAEKRLVVNWCRLMFRDVFGTMRQEPNARGHCVADLFSKCFEVFLYYEFLEMMFDGIK